MVAEISRNKVQENKTCKGTGQDVCFATQDAVSSKCVQNRPSLSSTGHADEAEHFTGADVADRRNDELGVLVVAFSEDDHAQEEDGSCDGCERTLEGLDEFVVDESEALDAGEDDGDEHAAHRGSFELM